MKIYTCLVGDIDVLEDPIVVTSGCDYLCFSDKPRNTKIWKIEPLLKSFNDPRLSARYHKTIGASYLKDDSLWIDAKLVFNKEIDFIEKEKSLCLLKHPIRNCIYQEGKAVINIGKARSTIVNKLLNQYREHGFPENNGLYETCLVFRKHSVENDLLNENWWRQIQLCIRDQLSLPYLLWQDGISPTILDVNPYQNNYFKVKHHPIGKKIIGLI